MKSGAAQHPKPSAGRWRLPAPVLLIAVTMALFALLLLVRPVSPPLVLTMDAVIQVLAPAIAAILCLAGVPLWGPGGPQPRVVRACGIGFISIFLANVLFASSYISSVSIAGHATFDIPGAVAFLDIVGYAGLVGAAFAIIGYPRSWYARGQLCLDGLLLLFAAAALNWYYLLGPAVLQAPNGLTNMVLSAILPLCDLVLLFPVVLMWLAPSTEEMVPVTRLFWIAMATNIVGDSANNWFTLHNPYALGTLADVASPTATLLAGYGAHIIRRVPATAPVRQDPRREGATLRRLLLPYAAIPSFAFLLFQVHQARAVPELAAGVVVALAAFVVLVLVRQTLVLLDIQQSELALRRSEGRLRAVMSHAPLAFFVLDLDGRYTLAAGHTRAWAGQLPGSVVGRSVFEMYTQTPDADSVIRKALAGEPGRIVIDEGDVALDCRLEPITDASGLVAEVVGVSLDITEVVRARQAAEGLARMRSDFVASVSHELRTPLTAIVGYAELLQARWAQMDDGQRLRQIDRIALSATRQRRLVDDLLLLSRTDAEGLVAICRPLVLGPVVERAGEEARAIYRNQRIDLTGAADLHVLADPDRTVQILTNLLDNAAKYSPEGSPIEVEWREVGGVAEVRVRDYGPGVPEEGRIRLFTQFGRIPESRIRAGRVGTGLGLYIGRMLAGAMGGELELEATGPAGSTFRLRLPVALSATSDDGAGSQPSLIGASHTR